jgi:hypothetical protein
MNLALPPSAESYSERKTFYNAVSDRAEGMKCKIKLA